MNFSKISTLTALVASTIVGFAATPAMAATFATDVFNTSGDSLKGTNRDAADRYFYDNALTPVDDKFYSLDFGESVIFEFGGEEFNSFQLWETTFNGAAGRANWNESVKVFASNDLNDFSFGPIEITNAEATDGYIYLGGDYKYLKITDTTDKAHIESQPGAQEGVNLDGFDIDAIAVKSAKVPEPTSILGLLAISGLGAAVVRKRQQNLG